MLMQAIIGSFAFKAGIVTADAVAVLAVIMFLAVRGRNPARHAAMQFAAPSVASLQAAPLPAEDTDWTLEDEEQLNTLLDTQEIPAPSPYLPVPPGPAEQAENFRRQNRRVLTVVPVGVTSLSVYGVYAVFSKSWDWLPLEASLLVFVPWMAYMGYLLWQRPVVTAESHSAMLARFSAHATTSVDVLIPTCGEALDVLANTFRYMTALDWPGPLRVYVLDESGREDVASLAARHGFSYLARPDRGRMKKAGNLNYGLAHSGGEFIAVFDADYAPAASFLMHTIPYFTEPATGIVQTPQHFDTGKDHTRSWIQRHSGVVQEMFMSWILPARQAHDSAFCIGSNVVYRRKAIAANGGFPEVDTGGEDIVTTWDLIGHGYHTVYTPVNLSKGLCPDVFDASVNQQYRWCLSSLVVLAGSGAGRARRSFWDSPMTARQRIHFFGGVLHYLQSVLALMLLAAPALVMLWAYPSQINAGTYLLTLCTMTGLVFMPFVLRGWRPSVMRFGVVCSVTHLIALWDTVFRTHQGWVPTGGSSSHKNKTVSRVSRITRGWVVVTQVLAWWGIARDMPAYGLRALWPAVVLTLFQGVILLPLLLPGYGTPRPGKPAAAVKPASGGLSPLEDLLPTVVLPAVTDE